jgi:hypothetical protein
LVYGRVLHIPPLVVKGAKNVPPTRWAQPTATMPVREVVDGCRVAPTDRHKGGDVRWA